MITTIIIIINPIMNISQVSDRNLILNSIQDEISLTAEQFSLEINNQCGKIINKFQANLKKILKNCEKQINKIKKEKEEIIIRNKIIVQNNHQLQNKIRQLFNKNQQIQKQNRIAEQELDLKEIQIQEMKNQIYRLKKHKSMSESSNQLFSKKDKLPQYSEVSHQASVELPSQGADSFQYYQGENLPIQGLQQKINKSSNQLHCQIQHIQDDFQIIRAFIEHKPNSQIAIANGQGQIDEFELEEKKVLKLRHKKQSFEAKLTQTGILFNKISQNSQWKVFSVYKLRSKTEQHKLTFKIHELRQKINFIIGIGLKQKLIDHQKFKKPNIYVFKPYNGKFLGNNMPITKVKCMKDNADTCQLKINLKTRSVIWQQHNANILHSTFLTQQMISDNLVVFIALYHPQDKVEMIVQ